MGAKTVTLGVAFLLGSICEAAGSIFLSKNVIDGISGNTSIVRMSMYKSDNATEVDIFEAEKFDVIQMMSLISFSYLSTIIRYMVLILLGIPINFF